MEPELEFRAFRQEPVCFFILALTSNLLLADGFPIFSVVDNIDNSGGQKSLVISAEEETGDSEGAGGLAQGRLGGKHPADQGLA